MNAHHDDRAFVTWARYVADHSRHRSGREPRPRTATERAQLAASLEHYSLEDAVRLANPVDIDRDREGVGYVGPNGYGSARPSWARGKLPRERSERSNPGPAQRARRRRIGILSAWAADLHFDLGEPVDLDLARIDKIFGIAFELSEAFAERARSLPSARGAL